MPTQVTTIRYILVWRRSPSSRFFDVQLTSDGSEIAVLTPESDGPLPNEIITDEETLVAYVNGEETNITRVEADLARRVLGWPIPS